jgi:hypothetical protein
VSDKGLPRRPDGLAPAGRAFWAKILAVYELSPAEVALLARCCKILDVLAQIDGQLRREGLVVRGHAGQPRPHPLLGSLSELSRTLETLIRGMALPMPGEELGRVRSPAQAAAQQQRWRKERGRGQVP